ncbi:hypothetical protein DAI22_05g143601 [Oryza sativa Japonica Group]|nr:hypothetical protein DAI22_05g143601 [Oryza sativa Japonica Group]
MCCLSIMAVSCIILVSDDLPIMLSPSLFSMSRNAWWSMPMEISVVAFNLALTCAVLFALKQDVIEDLPR